MRFRFSALIPVLFLALLAGPYIASVSRAATGSTVTIVTSNQLTSLNPDVVNDNLTVNTEVDYLQRSGFFYLNDRNEIVPNEDFGSYEITSQIPFRVKYTVKPRQVWSDGTPITAVDLLLDHVTCSARYSIAANLGNPSTSGAQPAFNSNCYGGTYGERHVGIPTISGDKMSLTIEYDRKFPEWLIFSPKPFPVHALVLISEGRNQLQNVTTSSAAKERFERAVTQYDTRALTAYGKVWSNSYKLTSASSTINPLLLISNGGYILDTFVPGQSFSFRYNEYYGSGPEVKGIERIVFRVIQNGTEAAQALRNGEVDILPGQPTADSAALFKSIPNVRVIDAKLSIYEHLDIRTGKASNSSEPYNGIFAGNTQRAQDLRKAFLLMIPRDEIVDKIIKPVTPSANRLDSLFYFNNDQRYSNIVSQNGSSAFTSGTQAQREAQALALVQKYYPNASASNPLAKVNLLWGTVNNARRVSVAQLIRAAGTRSGFDVNAPGLSNWSTNLSSSAWDASFFAWVRSDFSNTRNLDMYCGTCGNNFSGWSNSTIDSIYQSLINEVPSEDQKLSRLAQAEREINSNFWSIPLFQHPGIYAVSTRLDGLSPATSALPILWNYWNWTVPGVKTFPRYLVATPEPTPTPTPTPTTTPTQFFEGISPGSNVDGLAKAGSTVIDTLRLWTKTDLKSVRPLIVNASGQIVFEGVAKKIDGSSREGIWEIKFVLPDNLVPGNYIRKYLLTDINGTEVNAKDWPLLISPTPTPSSTPSPTASPSPTSSGGNINIKPKPANPTFSLVNFIGNKINISVNLGSGSSRADKVYLVAPKLGFSSTNPSVGTVSGDTANWTIELDKLLSGTMIPLEIISEKDGVRSDTVSANYQAPVFVPVIKAAPPAPTNLKSRIVGSIAVITATAKVKADSLASGAYLFSKSLGISKSKAIEGEVVGNKILLEVPIKTSMAGKKYPITVYLTNEKGKSKPLNGTLSVPAIAKPKVPAVAPKPNTSKSVLCFFGSQSRPFPGEKCPPGWTEG